MSKPGYEQARADQIAAAKKGVAGEIKECSKNLAEPIFRFIPNPQQTKFKVGQVWKTRCGELAEVEFIRDSLRTGWPVLVHIEAQNSDDLFACSLTGQFTYESSPHRFDLVELVK